MTPRGEPRVLTQGGGEGARRLLFEQSAQDLAGVGEKKGKVETIWRKKERARVHLPPFRLQAYSG